MAKSKMTLNTVLNFICILLFTAIIICYLSAFFKYNGQVASIHDLVGFPTDNVKLQEYIASTIKNTTYLSGKHELNFNAFVYGPVLIISTSLVGILLHSIKINSDNLCWYKISYGILGVLIFITNEILRLGKSLVFQVIIFSIVFTLGIAEVLIKFVFKKEIEFKTDINKIKTFLIAFFGITALVSIILFTTSNLKVKKQKYKISHPETVETQKEETVTEEKDDTNKLVSELIKGTPIDNIINMVESDQIKLNNKEEVLAELKNSNKENVKVMKFKEYTVKEGDTLIEICESEGINYYEKSNLIMAVNNLDSPSVISVDQVLHLPIE